MEFFVLIAVVFVIFLGVYYGYKFVQRRISKRKKEKDLILCIAELRVQMLVEDINFDYSLGLYENDIYAIVRSDNPLDELPRYIDYTPITAEVFVEEIISKADIFLNSSSLSEEEQSGIIEYLIEELNNIDDELVAKLVAYHSDMARNVAFLKGKINYTISTLGILQAIAEESNNLTLSNHIYQLRIKRGFVE